jgi:alkaline phosphatase D
VSQQPEIWIWGGDNIYGDSHDMTFIAGEYKKQKENPGYQNLLATCPVTGTWDDHDYGINDGGKKFSKKKESKVLAATFLGFDESHSVWKHEGLYNSTTLKKSEHSLHIINLDTRYFRDTIKKVYYIDSLTKKSTYRYPANPEGDMLGEAQWQWFENELKNTDASLFNINSSVQLLAEEHRFERWATLPQAQQRFFDLLKRYPHKKVIVISGDRHIAELSMRNIEGLPYPLYDFTASGLSHTWSETWEEDNKYRIGELIIKRNFGILDIDFSNSGTLVTFKVIGENNVVLSEHQTKF